MCSALCSVVLCPIMCTSQKLDACATEAEEGGAAGHKTGQLLVRSSQLVERDRSKVLSEFSVNS